MQLIESVFLFVFFISGAILQKLTIICYISKYSDLTIVDISVNDNSPPL